MDCFFLGAPFSPLLERSPTESSPFLSSVSAVFVLQKEVSVSFSGVFALSIS